MGKPWVRVTVGPRALANRNTKSRSQSDCSVWKVNRVSSSHPSRLQPEDGASWPSSAAPWAQQGLHHPARKMDHGSSWGFSAEEQGLKVGPVGSSVQAAGHREAGLAW